MDYFVFLDFNWHDLIQPQFYIKLGGLWVVLFVVFAETGLFAGFFLPGDSLLFVAGMFAHEIKEENGTVSHGLVYQFLDALGITGVHNQYVHLIIIIILIILSGIAGNTVGYWFGRKSGPALYKREDTFFFRKKHLAQAQAFFEKNGGFAVIVARFVPIVRTFVPIVAGIIKMDAKKYFFYNVVGCIAWVVTMVCAGFFLNKIFPGLQKRLELIVLAIVLISMLPILFKYLQAKRQQKNAATKV
jgi:membrane-associated protein